MAQNKCYICHNIRKIKHNGWWIETTNDNLKLVTETLEWDMFDGTHVKVEIFKCKDCIKQIEDIMNYHPEGYKHD